MTRSSRIFVVEDEALIAMELVDVLVELGYDVCGQAARADVALREIPEAEPDLVLMDINLGPGIGGIDIAVLLREKIEVPIIFLTAYSDAEVAERVAETGSYALLVKPFKPQALRANIDISIERHIAEKRLRAANHKLVESESKYRRVVEHISEAVLVANRDGDISFSNDRVRKIFGASANTRERASLGSLVSQDWREHVLRVYDSLYSVTAPSQSQQTTFQGLHCDGSTLWIEANFVAVTNDLGETVEAQVTLRDVSEQRRNNEALVCLSSELARLVGDALFSSMTRRLCQILGVEVGFLCTTMPNDQSRGWTTSFTVDGQSRPVRAVELSGLPCALACDTGVAVIEREAGVRYPMFSRLEVEDIEGYIGIGLRDSGGNPIGVIGVMSRRPVREVEQIISVLRLFAVRAAAEMEQRRQGARFENLFEFAPDAVLMVNADGSIDMANRVSSEMFGYTCEEFVGMRVEQLVPEQMRHSHEEQRRGYQRQPVRRRMESRGGPLLALHKDGSMIPVEISLSPFEAEFEARVVVAIRDVTAHLKARSEQELLAMQLSRAKKLEAMGMLAGGVSHDFNNLLTAIAFNVQLANRVLPDDHAAVVRLRNIERAADRAAALVGQILTVDPDVLPERSCQSLIPIVEDAVELVRSELPEHICIEVVANPELPKVAVNEIQFYQVMMNLMTNAVQSIGSQEGKVIVSLRPHVVEGNTGDGIEVEPGLYALVSVADDGEGIVPDCLENIFKPFYTSKRDSNGTGLGLSIVQRVVREHGGDISVSSRHGEGATFAVYLPAAETSPQPRTDDRSLASR